MIYLKADSDAVGRYLSVADERTDDLIYPSGDPAAQFYYSPVERFYLSP